MESIEYWNLRKRWPKNLPFSLSQIPHPPQKIFIKGKLPEEKEEGKEKMRYLCVVGPRKPTMDGMEICQRLIYGLVGYRITIVSGLAYGIDQIAHRSALEAGLPCLALPGSGLSSSVIYPRGAFSLSQEIIEKGGALLSEYENEEKAQNWMFPQRNRLMAGLSQAVLIIEAPSSSGTLITAKLALEYNREILVVPGPIFSINHQGSNELIKEGATVILQSNDILKALGLDQNLQ